MWASHVRVRGGRPCHWGIRHLEMNLFSCSLGSSDTSRVQGPSEGKGPWWGQQSCWCACSLRGPIPARSGSSSRMSTFFPAMGIGTAASCPGRTGPWGLATGQPLIGLPALRPTRGPWVTPSPSGIPCWYTGTGPGASHARQPSVSKQRLLCCSRRSFPSVSVFLCVKNKITFAFFVGFQGQAGLWPVCPVRVEVCSVMRRNWAARTGL